MREPPVGLQVTKEVFPVFIHHTLGSCTLGDIQVTGKNIKELTFVALVFKEFAPNDVRDHIHAKVFNGSKWFTFTSPCVYPADCRFYFLGNFNFLQPQRCFHIGYVVKKRNEIFVKGDTSFFLKQNAESFF